MCIYTMSIHSIYLVSDLELPSRSDTRYIECIDMVYIHIQSVLRLVAPDQILGISNV
jgi:hypothetical protein